MVRVSAGDHLMSHNLGLGFSVVGAPSHPYFGTYDQRAIVIDWCALGHLVNHLGRFGFGRILGAGGREKESRRLQPPRGL